MIDVEFIAHGGHETIPIPPAPFIFSDGVELQLVSFQGMLKEGTVAQDAFVANTALMFLARAFEIVNPP